MTLFLYLGKVMLSSAILYGYYRLFLRNKQFHHYNRFYLLSALLVSILLPFIKISFLYEPGNAVNEAVYQTIDVLTVNQWENEAPAMAATTASNVFTLENILYVFYAMGIAVVLVLLVKSLMYIRTIRRKYTGETINYLKFYNTKEPGTPFSFFRSIFWNDQLSFNSREGQQIFRHEVFHVQQRHSADILLSEIITALFWYNPVFYLIKKEIKAIHEFLADQYAASGSDRYAYAELLVKQTLEAKNYALSNHFFQNHIKRRIAMITQFQQSRYGYWSRVMVLPVSILLFCAFSLYAQQPGNTKPVMLMLQPVNTTAEPITIIVDPGHGGSDNGALSYEGAIKEKDIALQISKQIQQLAPGYKINVVLTRSEDILPGNAATPREGLVQRTNLMQQTNAAAFISIHASAAPKQKTGNDLVPNPSSGFEVFITNKAGDLQEKSRQLGMSVINSVSSLYTTKTSLLQRKEQGIWVLDNARCPAVIVECGYITNDKDVAFITDPGNQQLVAKKLLEAVLAYKTNAGISSQLPVREPSTTGIIHTVAAKQVAPPTSDYSADSDIEDIDIEKVKTLKSKQTTLAEIKRLFGEPARRTINGPYEEWYYLDNSVQFGANFTTADDKLVAFYYKATTNNIAPLNYAAVKSIKEKVTTAAEVKKLFGEPAEIYLVENVENWFFRTESSRFQVQYLNGKKEVEHIYYFEEPKKNYNKQVSLSLPADTIPVDTVTIVDVKVNKQENVNKQVTLSANTTKVNKQINVIEKVNNVDKKIKVNKNNNIQVNVDTTKPVIIKTTTNLQLKNGHYQTPVQINQKMLFKLDSISPKFVMANKLNSNFIKLAPPIKVSTKPIQLQLKYKPDYKLDLNIKTDSLKIYQPKKRAGKQVSYTPALDAEVRS